MLRTIFISICFLVLIILIVRIINNIRINSTMYKKYKTKHKLSKTKLVPEADVKYLFWTGGYDSTFRLCQLLIDEKKKVQPIYLYLDKEFVDSDKFERRNKDEEIETMQKITDYIRRRFPHTRNLLKDTHHVMKIKKDKKHTEMEKNLHNKLGFYDRPITQYERVSRFSKHFPYPIEVGLEDCRTGLNRSTKKHRTGVGENCRLVDNIEEKYKDLEVYRNLRFPIVHLTKKKMLDIAKKNNYKDVMDMTWSCWYPKDGKPCGNCEMCKQRIV